MKIQGIDTGDQTAVEGRHKYLIALRQGDWGCLDISAVSITGSKCRTGLLALLQRIKETGRNAAFVRGCFSSSKLQTWNGIVLLTRLTRREAGTTENSTSPEHMYQLKGTAWELTYDMGSVEGLAVVIRGRRRD